MVNIGLKIEERKQTYSGQILEDLRGNSYLRRYLPQLETRIWPDNTPSPLSDEQTSTGEGGDSERMIKQSKMDIMVRMLKAIKEMNTLHRFPKSFKIHVIRRLRINRTIASIITEVIKYYKLGPIY